MDIRKLVFDLVGCNFSGIVEEQVGEGLYVRYDGKSAVIAADTIPAKARGYMLLAKAIAEGKDSLEIRQNPRFTTVGPMLDLSRGGVMKVSSVKKYLNYMAAFGMNMLMLYTEDTYEVEGYPFFGYQRGRYTLKELREIDDYAYSLGIEVIPCIQTLGHMGQFLRYPTSGVYADTGRVLLIGSEKTYELIRDCIATCRKAFRTNRIHIGCDEARDLGLGKFLRRNGYQDRFELFNQHLKRVTAICDEFGYHPMMWSDMYYDIADKNKTEGYGENVQIPQYAIDAMPDCDMVFWDYYHTYNAFYRTNIEKHNTFGHKTVFAGGIWTQDGFVCNHTYTYDTMKPAMEECLRGGVQDVIITLWGNDGAETNYFLGLPMFSLFSEYCWLGEACTEEDIWSVSEFVTGMTKELASAVSDFFFGYEGSIRAGKHILWSDPLINTLFQGFDMAQGAKLLTDGLQVFEKYADHPDVEYFTAVFKASLHKCKIHAELRDRYKAGDRAWLRNFAENEIPVIVADFENLYKLHYDYWHRDYKTNGFERLMHRHAGAIERIKYTGRIIQDYLDGKLPEIEALEPELAFSFPAKWCDGTEFMYIGDY